MRDELSSDGTGTGAIDRSRSADTKYYATSAVTSKDGTKIGYRELGKGPGLVVLHGAFESAQSHM